MATKADISSIPIADLRNELEANGLSPSGNKSELVQKVYQLRRGKRTPDSRIAATFSYSPSSPKPGPSTSSPKDGRSKESINTEREDIDTKLAQHFDKLNKHLMLFVGAHAQPVKSKVPEFDLSNEEKFEGNTSQIFKLKRKLKLFGKNIEMIFGELEKLQLLPNASIEILSTLRRLNELEVNYDTVIQEILLLIPEDSEADLEIQDWAELQHEILRVSNKAKHYIESKQVPESKGDFKLESSDTHSCSGINHIRLPKFTLSVFNGDILEWVSWWDQFKSCIHENNSLGDMERFNYLLMYVSGSAKRAIEYIEVTSVNYKRAIEVLTKRYGRKRIVIEHLMNSMLKIERKEKINASSLRYLYDTMLNRYHTLKAHEPNLKYCDRIIIPILQSKLPQAVRKEWEYDLSKLENEEDDRLVTVEYFFDFLRAHVMSEEAAELSRPTIAVQAEFKRGHARSNFASDRAVSSSAVSLTTCAGKPTLESSKVECVFCDKRHDFAMCHMLKRKSVDERLELIKQKRLCFNCLLPIGPNHNSSTCKKPGCMIEGCNKKHHTLLHRVLTDTSKNHDSVLPVNAHVGLQKTSDDHTRQARLLPTALAKIHTVGKEVTVRVLVDSGSDHSYIRREVAEALDLKPNGCPTSMTIHMHGGHKKTTKVKNVTFSISNITDTNPITISAWSVNTVCAPLDPVQIDINRYPHLRDLKLAYDFPKDASTIDVLIGADQWGEVILNGIKKGPASTPFAVNSIFGWLLSGSLEGTSLDTVKSLSNCAVVRLEENADKQVNNTIKKFWEIESLGITDESELREVSGEEKNALDQFQSTVTFDGERYKVGLPWRRNPSTIQANYQQALRRLIQVERTLSKDKHKEEMYKSAMNQYLNDGHARKITKKDENQPAFYLPHHPVIREDRETTKCRVVFDASAKNRDGLSLNDFLLPGPSLHPNLLSILLRFRLNRVAMMADIKKMFLQIRLSEKDQNCHRFLWREDPRENPKIYCMTRVTFGVVSSPFHAIATVQHHCKLNKQKFPTAAKEVLENMYVDDLLTGASDVDQAITLHKELYLLLKSGGFDLVKWNTNSKDVQERIDPSLRGTSKVIPMNDEREPLKVLGISWDTNEDIFTFAKASSLLDAKDDRTKRSLISISARIFDPLGLLSPYTIRAKMLFQDLWSKGSTWDDPLDIEINYKWNKWKEELNHLKDLQIPRCPISKLSDVCDIQIHGFCDASLKAYGAAVYIRCEDVNGQVETHLLMAKSKLAPAKSITLPRLELLGALVLSRILKLVLDSIQLIPSQVKCWSDSQVVLEWIAQPSQKWKVFIANRVQEIKENISTTQWRYCPSSSNPADSLTRGEQLQKLIISNNWWKGPEWLSLGSGNWPSATQRSKERDEILNMTELLEERKQSATSLVGAESFQLEERYDKWLKLVRVTAWILKWKRCLKKPKLGYLTSEEIKDAEHTLLRKQQIISFQDEIGCLKLGRQVSKSSHIVKLDPQINEDADLLVVGGRLQFSCIPEEAKHQIIIPHKCSLTEKLILHIHSKANHAGPETTLGIMRQRFWPTQGRREVKRVIRKCLVCKHWKTAPVQQKMAPLPSDRVQVVPPFTNIGLDFTGPLFIKSTRDNTTTKAYICIFVCEDTRAVHLELTNNMTTEEFLQAYQRMVSRRGVPTIVRSDNQTTFHKAAKVFKLSKQRTRLANINAKEVEAKLANDNTKWKFITERASHRGGHWERVCRQIKEPLRRVLGKALLTYTEMYTVLTSIEATINSRPLTFIGDDIRDGKIITPALLAIGRDLGHLPNIPVRTVSLNERFYYQQGLQNHFWKRWTREYLPSLTVRQKWNQEVTPLKENDVVLISDDNLSRGRWKLGKVIQTFPGTDGLIRTVRVQTKQGKINRPVQRLHLLEAFKEDNVYNNELMNDNVNSVNSNVIPSLESDSVKSNDIPSLKGENVRTSKYGRLLRNPHRY